MRTAAKNYLKPKKVTKKTKDWVCCLCQNLNFSFRTQCNRCRVQTRAKNQLDRQERTQPQFYSVLLSKNEADSSFGEASTMPSSARSQEDPILLKLTGLPENGFKHRVLLCEWQLEQEPPEQQPFRSPGHCFKVGPLLEYLRKSGKI